MKFGDLRPGEYFKYLENPSSGLSNPLFMKLLILPLYDGADNAVEINVGETYEFSDEDLVRKVSVTIGD